MFLHTSRAVLECSLPSTKKVVCPDPYWRLADGVVHPIDAVLLPPEYQVRFSFIIDQ
jgi:hypothetical protein